MHAFTCARTAQYTPEHAPWLESSCWTWEKHGNFLSGPHAAQCSEEIGTDKMNAWEPKKALSTWTTLKSPRRKGAEEQTDLKHVSVAQHVEHGVNVRLAREVKACPHEPLWWRHPLGVPARWMPHHVMALHTSVESKDTQPRNINGLSDGTTGRCYYWR